MPETLSAAASAFTSMPWVVQPDDTLYSLLMKFVFGVLSTFALPWMLSFIHRDNFRRALFKGAEAFIRAVSEDLLQDSDSQAGFARLLKQFRESHPLAAGADKLVELALRAALNRLTHKVPASSREAGATIRVRIPGR